MGLRNLSRRSKALIALLLFLLLHIAVLLSHTFYVISDDFTYLYMGKLIAEGSLPYRDFFVGHPPLQLYIYAGLILIFGAKAWLASVSPIFSILLAGYVAYKITNRIDIMVFFLAVFPIFHLSTVGFGLNLGLAFIMLSFYYINRKPLISGILAGLSVFCRLHFLPIAATALFLQNRPPLRAKYMLGGVVMALLFCIMLFFLPEGLNQMFFYHIFKDWRYFTAIRYFIFGIGIAGLWISRKTRYFLPFMAYLVFLLLLKSVFAYYLIPLSAILVLAYADWKAKAWKKVIIAGVMIGLSIGATLLTMLMIYEDRQEVKMIVTAVKDIPGELCGNNEIVPLVALRTQKNIKGNEVDTNSQRHKILNCSDAITIYRFRSLNNCTIIKKWEKYVLGVC